MKKQDSPGKCPRNSMSHSLTRVVGSAVAGAPETMTENLLLWCSYKVSLTQCMCACMCVCVCVSEGASETYLKMV